MKRMIFDHRQDWRRRCEEAGFRFHTIDENIYWREGAGYKFTSKEIDLIDDATAELHGMCMDLVDEIVKSGDYRGYGFRNEVISLIERSWRAGDPHIYGRFDLAFNEGKIKMLEYNADTPTSLVESSIAQWFWLEDRGLPDQFNSIHEKLIERWRQISPKLPVSNRMYFTTMREAGVEDWSNLGYMASTAVDAGIDSFLIDIEDIGWDESRRTFVDQTNGPIMWCFKLYPWEWMMKDEFGNNIPSSGTKFLEPPWKMLLSNKVLLSLLWQRHENHPLLLPAYLEKDNEAATKIGKWARKPMLAREGANLSLLENGAVKSLTGSIHNPNYDHDYVLQQWVDLPAFDGMNAVIGSWVIGDEPAGIGIREDSNTVTGNASFFVPHYFTEE